MKIGILGTGNIGATLAKKFSAAGHDVKVANSRGPETIDAGILADGARAVTSADAVVDVDVVILSTPLGAIPKIAPLVADLPADTVVIDTSNYYPGRDGTVAAIEDGQTESAWVAGQLGRPIAKAWNAITSASFAEKGQPAGRRGASPFLSPPMARRSARWRWPLSRKPALMRFIPVLWTNHGVSSRVPPATARTWPASRCRTR
jgi:predicted dinucleotide-binding enzyme